MRVEKNVSQGGASDLEQKAYYEKYYASKGADRNNVMMNAGARWQTFFSDIGYVDAIALAMRNSLPGNELHVLDVGCGNGSSLLTFLQLGFSLENISGVDVQAERIEEGKRRYPGLDVRAADGRSLPFADEIFDIVTESTMFVSLSDETIAMPIADEMCRVTKRGGFLLLRDWTTPLRKPDVTYSPLTTKRMTHLFKIGTKTKMFAAKKGALLPPLGRTVGRFAPSLYQLFQMVPFATGQHIILLQKL